ncbi:alanine dehydrogenase [Rufibacter radiotolerans]|uniref:Alanine dehydrogenase n=1 Tax=Rufibacter radiotolerans TaxID=1379910 RepID=A0A0H4VIK6_9BACT|nr:XdhC/CoxI family protein [Rufibacter radiotolerans]AKQ45620.1 alanine dehydrogenase [Rufibacter radiotolerans]
MKEIQDIVAAYARHQEAGLQTALATVVKVEGSAYRRPGARMLVAEDGQLTGAISGGCLEGDALRKARLAMAQGKPTLVKYDTMDDDDAKLGVGLGCNGIIHILIEPLLPFLQVNQIALLQDLVQNRQTGVLVTLFSLQDRKGPQPGTCLLLKQDGALNRAGLGALLEDNLLQEARTALHTGVSTILDNLPPGNLTAFVEVVKPAIAVVICGAGNDVMPLVQMTHVLGWPTTVIDGRAAYATQARFPTAHQVLVAKPEAVLSQLTVDQHTVFLLFTHNYNYDLAMLRQLLPLSLPYIGVLGPKKKIDRLLTELRDEGHSLTPEFLKGLFGPTGLDIGAETPEEIALSVVAEIKKVLSQRRGTSLREKETPIHFPALEEAKR